MGIDEGVPRSGPWDWRPARDSWFARLRGKALAWRPGDALGVDADAVSACLSRAIDKEADWLVHPCLSAVTGPGEWHSARRDLRAVVWLAARSGADLGEVTIPWPVWLWSADGGFLADVGRHDLRELGGVVASASSPAPVDLDVWCRSLGEKLPGSWAAALDGDDPDTGRLQRETEKYLRTVCAAEQLLPDCMSWICSVTRVAIPLRNDKPGTLNSGSNDSVPGMVFFDLAGADLRIMEALVHESAHHHVYFAEAAGPLVRPGHAERYSSPLRLEPRPLRGVLLAYHAIAYICAFYQDLRAKRGTASALLDKELEPMILKLDETARTLERAGGHLTAAGGEFLAQTAEVAAHGRG